MMLRLVRLLERAGRDADALLGGVGVSPAEITSASARVPYPIVDALIERAVAELGAETFALSLSAVTDADTYDAAGLVLMTSPTFGEGLARAFAFQRLWADGERFSLRRDATSGVVGFVHPGASAIAGAALTELAFIETMNGARLLARPDVRAERVSFTHARLGALDDVFGVVPTYGVKKNELVLSDEVLSSPVQAPEGAILAMHELFAERALRALPASTSLTGRIRALFHDDPSVLALDVTAMATRLRLTPRTLQRRLSVECTSWSDLVDDARRARVRELTLRHVSEKEIAFLVGFSDPSALVRARARWARMPR